MAKAQEQLARAIELGAVAQQITSDLTRPNPRIYWTDLLLTAAVVYGGLALAVLGQGAWAWIGALAAVLALYRAVSFIHELTHLRAGDAPGFRAGWNALIGVPFLAPSLLYEGVHNLHHLKQLYGTADDPEYLPLARGRPLAIAGFLAVAGLAPLGSFLRFAVLGPLSLLAPRWRPAVVARFSAMCINPAFRRQDFGVARRPAWRAQEIGAWLWSWTLVGLVVAGGLPARFVLTGVAIMAAVTLVNQLRTLVAHAWRSDGRPMTLTEQYLDSINVPRGWLPLLWAPVGLRYHALHHLLPRVPYHNLAEAHRRLAAALPRESAYHGAHHRGLFAPLKALIASSAASARGQGPA
ncbi:fatty acid desaturase [Phenylobacterium sp. LjRoot219]|uniref:fatty acid desaturase family protein n=1 Tax=Phenylobacterium sp. LjRoot219 TaxID=3342283 RepID=UPI003ED0BD1A